MEAIRGWVWIFSGIAQYQLRKCMLKIVKFTDACMTGGMHYTPSHTNVCKFYNFQLTFFSADISPEILTLTRVTKV